MPETVKVEEKSNGFIVTAIYLAPDKPNKEILVEGRDPKKIGTAVLSMFQKPRKPRAKRAEMDKVKAGTA